VAFFCGGMNRSKVVLDRNAALYMKRGALHSVEPPAYKRTKRDTWVYVDPQTFTCAMEPQQHAWKFRVLIRRTIDEAGAVCKYEAALQQMQGDARRQFVEVIGDENGAQKVSLGNKPNWFVCDFKGELDLRSDKLDVNLKLNGCGDLGLCFVEDSAEPVIISTVGDEFGVLIRFDVEDIRQSVDSVHRSMEKFLEARSEEIKKRFIQEAEALKLSRVVSGSSKMRFLISKSDPSFDTFKWKSELCIK
jgi:hypothetical protein